MGDLSDRVRELLPDGVVDELLAGAHGEEEIVGPGGLLSQLTKRLVERAMEVELTDHLGYEPHLEPPGATGNARNGSTPKTLMTEHGPVAIDTPRDRAGTFDPQIVRKRQRRFEGFWPDPLVSVRCVWESFCSWRMGERRMDHVKGCQGRLKCRPVSSVEN